MLAASCLLGRYPWDHLGGRGLPSRLSGGELSGVTLTSPSPPPGPCPHLQHPRVPSGSEAGLSALLELPIREPGPRTYRSFCKTS